MQSPFSVDSSQINLLKNLDDIDDIFNGLAHEDDAQLDQDFEDFLECFSEENDDDDDQSQDDSNYRGFPSFRNVSPSFNLSTFADSNPTVKKTEDRLLQATGDNQYPCFDDEQQEDSVEENQEDDLSDFFDSFDVNQGENEQEEEQDDVNYIEIKYFDETYKIPIFTAKLFEQEQTLEDKLIFENAELVLSKKKYDLFQSHIQRLHFQRPNEDTSFPALILSLQKVLLADTCQQFNVMLKFLQNWEQKSPSNTCKSMVGQFKLQFKQFQDAVNYVIDCNSNKMTSRRYFDKIKPAYFQDNQKQDKQKKEMTEEERIQELQQIPYNQHQNTQSNLVSILYFKGNALFESFEQFLHYRSQTEKYQEINKRLSKVKDVFILNKMLKNKIEFSAKNRQQLGKQQQIEIPQERFIQFYHNVRTMKINKLSQAFRQNPEQTLYKSRYLQLPKTKYLTQKYLQFSQEVF